MEVRTFRENEQEKIKNFIAWILDKEFSAHDEHYGDEDLDNLKKIYQRPGCIMLIIEEEGHLIGTVAVKDESKDVALIRRFFVHPAYRRRGFGSVLLHRALDFCRLTGYKRVVFHATSNMSHAIALCQKSGFKENTRVDFENSQIISLHHSF